jgi:hypothetical protein
MNRTIVRVIGTYKRQGQALFVIASVPGWNPDRMIWFPASRIPKEIRDEALKKVGTRLFAHVNLGASKSKGLLIDNFELAPEPGENDGLG